MGKEDLILYHYKPKRRGATTKYVVLIPFQEYLLQGIWEF